MTMKKQLLLALVWASTVSGFLTVSLPTTTTPKGIVRSSLSLPTTKPFLVRVLRKGLPTKTTQLWNSAKDDTYRRHYLQHDQEDEEEEEEQAFRQMLDSMQELLNAELMGFHPTSSYDQGRNNNNVDNLLSRPIGRVPSSSLSTSSSVMPDARGGVLGGPAVVLTHTAIRRRQIEIRLLESLDHSDEAVDELMNIWIHSEMPYAHAAIETIHRLEENCNHEGSSSSSSSLQETAAILTNMCRAYPKWPEIHSRLALVLAMLGRTLEASVCVAYVLQMKPWHFEAQQMQVLLALQPLDDDDDDNVLTIATKTMMARAIHVARSSLPPLSQPKRRHRWVQTAVQQAQERLAHDMAQSSQQRIIESSTATTTTTISVSDVLRHMRESDDDSAWQ